MSIIAQYTLILIVYFAGLMGLGIWSNRRTRSRTDYFLARGKLGPGTIGFSYSATQMSGSSYMGGIGSERLLGYNFSPAGVTSAAAPWFTYVLLGDRLQRIASRIKWYDDHRRVRGALLQQGGWTDGDRHHAGSVRPDRRGAAEGGG